MKIISKISFSLSFPIILFALVFGACKNTKKEPITINNFSAADEIIKSIQILTFPDTNFNIMDFGAIADGETNNSEAIKKASLHKPDVVVMDVRMRWMPIVQKLQQVHQCAQLEQMPIEMD